jgi:group II intron reverse transcriptase/maturase
MKVVEAAYKGVKAKKGAAGVDKETIEEFEKNYEKNLYKIWNRMSSGSYFPPPVRTVEIPKGDGKSKRKLGIPTVSDRVAQMVAVKYLEPIVEPKFHDDSYGFRKGRSQKDALVVTRKRCYTHNWVIDLDISGFFDNIDFTLMMNAVKRHTDCKWLLLYIERWLKAPIEEKNGELRTREKGTPQGGVISPLLANIFLHHAFDEWMAKEFESVPFERYADDAVVHCRSKAQAEFVLRQIERRLREWKLELHPEKTRIVYCKDSNRTEDHENVEFDFLGFTFKCRKLINQKTGKKFGGFAPAISKKASRKIRKKINAWQLQRRTDLTLQEQAERCNRKVRGWFNYYGMFSKSVFLQLLFPLNRKLAKWARRKYKKSIRKAWRWLRGVNHRNPTLFVHWSLGVRLVRRIGAV